MSDIERFKDVYRSFGIECKEFTNKDSQRCIILAARDWISGEHDGNQTESDKFDGHSGFFTEVVFDADGKFVSQGFWE